MRRRLSGSAIAFSVFGMASAILGFISLMAPPERQARRL